MFKIFVVCAGILLMSIPAQAELYKCKCIGAKVNDKRIEFCGNGAIGASFLDERKSIRESNLNQYMRQGNVKNLIETKQSQYDPDTGWDCSLQP